MLQQANKVAPVSDRIKPPFSALTPKPKPNDLAATQVLEKIQKSLEDYLETKRMGTPSTRTPKSPAP